MINKKYIRIKIITAILNLFIHPRITGIEMEVVNIGNVPISIAERSIDKEFFQDSLTKIRPQMSEKIIIKKWPIELFAFYKHRKYLINNQNILHNTTILQLELLQKTNQLRARSFDNNTEKLIEPIIVEIVSPTKILVYIPEAHLKPFLQKVKKLQNRSLNRRFHGRDKRPRA